MKQNPVPVSQPQPISVQANGLFKVQVGAFSQIENAVRLAAELKSKGYSVIIIEE